MKTCKIINQENDVFSIHNKMVYFLLTKKNDTFSTKKHQNDIISIKQKNGLHFIELEDFLSS